MKHIILAVKNISKIMVIYSFEAHFLVLTALVVGSWGDFNPHMDSVYLTIDWPGSDDLRQSVDTNTRLSYESSASVIVTTTNKEKYRCMLPSENDASQKEKDNHQSATYAFELDLLKPLFDQTICTYRLETYWTYELCHGKHLRQYHEEKEIGKKTRLTEYYLGRYTPETFLKDIAQAKAEYAERTTEKKLSVRKKKVQGVDVPYYEVVYSDGTLCDLTGRFRRAALHYVCQPDGRGEIYELKETSSCEYEVVILTSLLCSHASYGPKQEQVSTIRCHSLDGSPRQPVNLNQFVEDQFGHSSNEVDDEEEEEEEHADDEDTESVKSPTLEIHTEQQLVEPKGSLQIGEQTDKQLLKDFIAGDFCIRGGTGWWHYEFCYGKHVSQYHEEKTGKVVIKLGEWNTAAHLLWISNNSKKRPAPIEQRKLIRHYYGNGDFCKASGKHRFSEVKLRCNDDPNQQHSMSIYVFEPKPCEYQIVVESRLLCSVISQADDNGLVLEPNI